MRLRSHLFLAVMLCASAAAQRPSSWAVLPLPNGALPAAVLQLGKLVVYVENGTVHVFSAFTRCWHSYPVSGGAQLREANDWLLIRDGTSYTAFSSMRGTFETISVSPAAVVVNPANQRNDSILLVRDGPELYSFSGFRGQWVLEPLSLGAAIAVQRHVALVADGTELLGLSAFGATWVRQRIAAPVSSLFADGTVGVAQDASTIWGFSAQRQTWSQATNPGLGTLPTQKGDVAVWAGPTRVLGFSGLLGEFRGLTIGTPAQLTVDQQLAAATAGNSVAFFSAPTAQWTVFGTFSPATLTTSAATALLAEADTVHAYSALSGAISSHVVTPTQTEVNWTTAAVVESGTGVPHLFSAFTDRWITATTSPLGLFPMTAVNGALLQTATGFAAFSARTGAMVPLAEAQTATPHVNLRSGILAVQGSSEVHVFDSRRDAWISAPLQGSGSVSVAIWRTSLIARQGRRCWGYGSQHGEIEVFDLPEDEVNTRVSSESASIVTSRYLVGYSPVPDLLPLSQFPEFRRLFADGGTLELQLRGEVAAPAAILLGRSLTAGLVLPFGTLFLDPGSMAVLWANTIPPSGTAVIRIPLPVGLHGLRVAFQAGLLPTGGAYLSRMSTLYVP